MSQISIPVSEWQRLQEQELILHGLQQTAKIGWWEANLNTSTLLCSDYVVELLELEHNTMSNNEFLKLVNEGHRERVGVNFSHIHTRNLYDEYFPMCTKFGEIWIHSKLANKTIRGDGMIIASGYLQVLDEEMSHPALEKRDEIQLKELMFRQNSLSQSLSNFLKNTDTSQVITETLRSVLEQFKGDRTYIFRYDTKRETQSCIYEVTREKVCSEIDSLQGIATKYNAWWSKHILNNLPIIINNLDELPPEATYDKMILTRQDIASLMVVPLVSPDGIWGYMGIDIVDHPHLWTNIDKEWFFAMSNIIHICFELRESEKKAQQDQRYLKNLYDHMPIGYLRLQLLYTKEGLPYDYKYLDFNPAFVTITGKEIEKHIGKTAREVHADQADGLDQLHRISLSKKVVETDHTSEQTGKQYHTTIYSQENGEVVILFTDITERMKAIEALRRGEETLRKIYKYIPVGIEVYDKEGYLVDLNDIEMELFGFEKKEDVIGLNMFNNPNIPQDIQECLRQGKDITFTLAYKFSNVNDVYYKTKNTGTKNLMVKGTYLYDNNHQIENYLLIVIDNTDTLKAYKKIQEFEVLFNDIAEFSKVGICRLNPLQHKFFGSKVWFHNLNQESRTIHDITEAYEHVHPDDYLKLTSFFHAAKCGEVSEFADEIRIQFGVEWRWMRARFKVKKYNPQNQDIELIGLNIDITEAKATEQNLVAAKLKAEESDRLKSAFLANMSHEIRTPLNAIVGFSNLLAETDNLANREQYRSLIQTNNDLLLQLISDILDLSKIEAGTLDITLTNIDVNQLCEDIVCSLAMKVPRNVTLSFAEHEPSCFTRSDQTRITQVLSNFVNNAIKFTTRGSIQIGYEIQGSQIKFHVQDTGIGIAGEYMNTVFNRFVKLNSFIHGTGLGLSICKSIIEKLGGEIGVVSTLGKGSDFWFTLPFTPVTLPLTSPRQEKAKNTEKISSTRRKKILVAEDTDSNYLLVVAILKNKYDLVRAQTGTEAIKLYRMEHPDLILMDIQMPEMDGLTATKEIRKEDQAIHIIAVTAYAYDSDKEKAFNAGCNNYLSKPISPEVLKKIIELYS